MVRIEIPNTNPVLDPGWAVAQTKRAFTAQLEVARGMCDYGSDLLRRVFETSEKNFGDLIALVLFRQFLAMFDTVVIGLENGAAYGAEPSLRAALEASWSLEWLLTKGSDHDRRCFYVADIRNRRLWNRAFIKGTREYAAFRQSGSNAAQILEASGHLVSGARADLKRMSRFLQRPSYRAINAEFAKREKKYRAARTVPWYQVSKARSPRMMAKQLGREDEYWALYQNYSGTTHGAKVRPHVGISGDRVTVEPIRLPDNQWGSTFTFAIALALKTYRVFVRSSRPDEEERFDLTYIERWRNAFLNVPSVTVDVATGPYGADV